MKRKLIKQGGSGLTLYLPKKWIDKKGLQNGDEIEVTEENEHLIISTHKALTEKKEIKIKLETTDENYIKALLNNLYRKGYTKVILETNHAKLETDTLYIIVEQFLLGFEITDVSKNTYTIENISEPVEKEDIILRRIFILLKNQFKLICDKNDDNKIIFSKNYERVKKYDNYCRRISSRNKEEGSKWVLFSVILQINSQLKRLYNCDCKNIGKDTIIKIKNIYEQLYTNYYKGKVFESKDASIEAYNLYDKLLSQENITLTPEVFHTIQLSRLMVLLNSAFISIIV